MRNGLRITVGDGLLIGDGHGRRYRTTVTAVTRQAVTASIIETQVEPPRQAPTVVVGQALLKGDKMDWVIQKATELGVSTLIPLQTRHAVVQPKADRLETQRARWQRIALEAAQQSEQWTVAAVTAPQALSPQLEGLSGCMTRLMLTERRQSGPNLGSIPLPTSAEERILILVGPEGGWAPEELAAAETLASFPSRSATKFLERKLPQSAQSPSCSTGWERSANEQGHEIPAKRSSRFHRSPIPGSYSETSGRTWRPCSLTARRSTNTRRPSFGTASRVRR